MWGWLIALAILVVLAAVFGYTGAVAGAAWAAQVLFFVFLALFVVAAIAYVVRRQAAEA